MLSSARSCAGENLKRLRPTKSAISTIHEPLLFLYPTWFQYAARDVQKRRVHVKTSTGTEAGRKPDEKLSSARSGASTFVSGVAVPSTASQTSDAKHNARPRRLNLNNIAPGRAVSREEDVMLEKQREASVNDNPALEASAPRRNFNPAEIDGLNLARKLASVSNSTSLTYTDSLTVSARFLDWLVGTSERNMWFHRENSGCRIHVVSPTDHNYVNRDVLLEGSERSRELSRRYLVGLSRDFERRGSQASVRPTTAIPEQQKRVELCKEYVHVGDVVVPSTWSIKSFHSYVQSILAQRAPRAIERSLYPGDNSFDQAASHLLLETFQSEALSPYQSVAALRLVLENFRSRTQAATNIGSIWKSAIENGLVPDISCFNLEIERCISVNNVDRVEYLMWNMRLFQTKPDASTWALLLRTLRTSAQRRNLINTLLRGDHLPTSQDRDIITRALIVAEFKHVVAVEDGIPKFAKWLHKRFGNGWLSPGAVCDMIEQCMRSIVPWKVHEILDIARYFGIALEQLDDTALLDIIRRTKHFGDTLWFFKAITPNSNHQAAQAQLDLLFKLAWSQKLFNTSRLIWRYSASRGLISHSMQRLVIGSLAMNHSSKVKDGVVNHRPDPRLAAMTIGTNIDVEDFPVSFPILSKHENANDPAQLLCQWMPNDGSRHEQLQLAHLFLERDLTATKTFRPMRFESFIKQLDQTFRTDVQWKRDKFTDSASVAELFGQSVKVGLHRSSLSCSTTIGNPSKLDPNLPTSVTVSPLKTHEQIGDSQSTDKTPILAASKGLLRGTAASAATFEFATSTVVACPLMVTHRSSNFFELILQQLGQALKAG